MASMAAKKRGKKKFMEVLMTKVTEERNLLRE
jgi:hypothetical protein